MKDSVEFSADGVRVSEDYRRFDQSHDDLLWHPASEFEGLENAPDALEVPNLPIPFTAPELTAFMLNGVGAMLPSIYGDWASGPDEGLLANLGANAGMPREALRAAYAAYRDAEMNVGKLDIELQQRAPTLRELYELQNGLANTREGVFDQQVSRDESIARRQRAKDSVAHLLSEAKEAERLAKSEFARWRKAMVLHLLRPQSAEVSKVRKVGAMTAHRQNLLRALTARNLDPKALPAYKNGNMSTAKKEAMRALCVESNTMSEATFDKTWLALLKDGEIAYASP
ncbi:hypothetical protein [Variovorax sp.]|uniref:hypothetical protein n=1 Tax=Variovorax sp. TaxID=1871043 RepID=UPI003BA9F26D